MSDTERVLMLEALVSLWETETNRDVLSDRSSIERLIAWQVLSLSGAYDRHAAHMSSRRVEP